MRGRAARTRNPDDRYVDGPAYGTGQSDQQAVPRQDLEESDLCRLDFLQASRRTLPGRFSAARNAGVVQPRPAAIEWKSGDRHRQAQGTAGIPIETLRALLTLRQANDRRLGTGPLGNRYAYYYCRQKCSGVISRKAKFESNSSSSCGSSFPHRSGSTISLASNALRSECEARVNVGTGTGIRTPVPWLRTTCPDP